MKKISVILIKNDQNWSENDDNCAHFSEMIQKEIKCNLQNDHSSFELRSWAKKLVLARRVIDILAPDNIFQLKSLMATSNDHFERRHGIKTNENWWKAISMILEDCRQFYENYEKLSFTDHISGADAIFATN